jgi:hypothetical protein
MFNPAEVNELAIFSIAFIWVICMAVSPKFALLIGLMVIMAIAITVIVSMGIIGKLIILAVSITTILWLILPKES